MLTKTAGNLPTTDSEEWSVDEVAKHMQAQQERTLAALDGWRESSKIEND